MEAKTDMDNDTLDLNPAQTDVADGPFVSSSERSKYNPYISRRLMEALTNTSIHTLIKYEQEGIITPLKSKQGAQEIVVYEPTDVAAVFKKRGISFKTKDEAEVIAVFNQKGGTGKTAFTQHLSSMLSLVGKVLVIDMDSQSDATFALGAYAQFSDIIESDDEMPPTIQELMDWTLADGSKHPEFRVMGLEDVVKVISPTLHVIPSDLDMSEINYSLNNFDLMDEYDDEGNKTKVKKLYMVKEVVDKLKDKYDFILFDCPPNIEVSNVNTLFSANRILIPLGLEARSIKIMERNEDFLYRLKDLLRRVEPDFDWEKILVVPNMFKNDSIKIKAYVRLQDIYKERDDFILSNVFLNSSVLVDKCTEMKEPVFLSPLKSGKEFKGNVRPGKELTNNFWVVMHEILDLEPSHLPFPEVMGMES